MSVNAGNLTISIEQAGRVLNETMKQATGRGVLAQINTGDYTSIATMALRVGYENMTNALSQVLTRTQIRVRPYAAKFPYLRKTEEQWGNMERKISYADRDIPEGDMTRDIQDGQTYSPYKVRKPIALQMAYYGFNHIDDYMTLFKTQWDTALQGPEQFRNFVQGFMQEWYDKLEQYREQYSRLTLVNLIGGTCAAEDTTINKFGGKNPERVRHLLTEYNTRHGTKLTAAQLFADDAAFTKFAEELAAEMDTIVQRLTERTVLYHTRPVKSVSADGNTIEYYDLKRHTPASATQCYMLNDFWNKVKRMVRPGLFANEFLEFVKFEGVNFWQSIDTPEQINASVSYFQPIAATGDVGKETAVISNDSAEAEVELPYVLGVMFDEEAAAICYKNMWSAATPMNPAHGFQTNYIHEDVQWRNDNTENCVVFLLD